MEIGRDMRDRMTAGLVGAGLALLPAVAWGQAFTDPLVPVPPIPVAPSIPATAPAGQFLPLGQSVTARPRPEYDPLGIRAGDFFFFPRLETDLAYDDNIFATKSNTTGDFLAVERPGIDMRSNLPQNAINFSAGAALSQYFNHSNFNSNDGFGDLNGRLDVDNQHYATAELRAEKTHIDIGAPEVPGNAAEPLRYNDYSAILGFDQYRLRIGYEITGTVRREEFQATPLVGGGFTFNSNLNNFAYEGAVRPYYEFQPGYQGYIRFAYNKRDYDHAAGNGIPTLSSSGYRGDVGARINLTGVTYIDAFVGYLQQNYEANSFGSIGGVDFGANLVWNATQLTSVSFKSGRTVEDINNAVLTGAAAQNSPGYLETTAAVIVDHELLRNVLLNGTLAYTNDNFQNISRVDNSYGAGVGVKYLFNRYLYLGANYTFQHVDSTGTSAMTPFTRNIILLRLSTQL